MNRRSWTLGAMAFALAASSVGAFELPAPVTDADFPPINRAEAELGQLLFYDPILSGNRNISCGTCHHPKFGTSDGVSLSLGEGGIGLGPDRRADPENMPEQRIPRNAPALWNLGAREFTVLFHDGRIETDASKPGGIRTPLGDDMAVGFSGVLSAQTMFPVLSGDEMAGHYSENDIAQAVRQGRITGQGGAWDLMSKRIAEIPEYEQAFNSVYPEIAAGRAIAFTDISNAIAAFVAFEWRSNDSPFDDHLNGLAALPEKAQLGMTLFYDTAGCATCHAGKFQTDHSFHAMAVPQLGPGLAEQFENHARDTGRMRVTGKDEDAYRFRTPSLRNIMHTGPYGHSGAYRDLRAFLQQHTMPDVTYDRSQAVLPDLLADDWRADDADAIRASYDSVPMNLTDEDLDHLIAFLDSLTGLTAEFGRLGVPEAVPSGLPVDR